MIVNTCSDILFQLPQLEGLTCYDGEDLPDLYVKVGIMSTTLFHANISIIAKITQQKVFNIDNTFKTDVAP